MEKQKTELLLFTTLFNRYKEPFTLFANSYVKDRAVAEDIYMEAIGIYWEKRNDLPAETNIPGYILTCVRNKALSYLRHLNIIYDVHKESYEHRLRESQFRISSLEDCEPSELFSEEIKQIVQETFNELPEQTRIIFFKSRYEGKTNREIADELNVSIKTVEFHISKVLKVFRIRLKDYLPAILMIIGAFKE